MTHSSPTLGIRADEGLRTAMRLAAGARLCANRVTVAVAIAFVVSACVAFAGVAAAGEVDVSVTARSGGPVSDVVVMVAPLEPPPSVPPRAAVGPTVSPAVMDQRQLAFEPRVLVVAVGTQVEFPNNDTVSHQVYSFSAAKKFQLSLYKGEAHTPVLFDRAGLVVLGCNIHDQMAGYIYVTDAPYFGKTDGRGYVHLPAVPTGEYRVTLWSPFIADAATNLARTLHVDAHEPASMRVQLSRDLRAQPEPRPRRGDWEY